MANTRWRLAKALTTLRNEVNVRWPKRDKTSDGTIGDAAHAARSSDHNPWIKDPDGTGVVRAFDCDRDGIDADWLAEHIRALGMMGDARLSPTGYVIFRRRIAGAGSTRQRWEWRPYSGANAHEHHVHTSFTQKPGALGFDSEAGWGITADGGLIPSIHSVFQFGDHGPAIEFLRAMLTILARCRIPASGKGIGAALPAGDVFDAQVREAVREFQRFANAMYALSGQNIRVQVDGIVGPITLKLMEAWVPKALAG